MTCFFLAKRWGLGGYGQRARTQMFSFKIDHLKLLLGRARQQGKDSRVDKQCRPSPASYSIVGDLAVHSFAVSRFAGTVNI